MHSTNAKLFTVFVIFSVFSAIGLRLAMFHINIGSAANVIYYALVVGGFVMIAVDSFRNKKYANAFIFKNDFHLNIFSYLASAGFFIDFVYQCVKIFLSVEEGTYVTLTYFVPVCLICFFALISCFYFYTIGLSFGDKNYDFRELKVIHIAPIFWAISRILTVIQQAINPLQDINSILKYTLLIFGVCFFYCFATEIESTSSAKAVTVYFARLFSYSCVLYFADSLMMVLSASAKLGDEDTLLAISVLPVCAFVFFFEKNVISHNSLE